MQEAAAVGRDHLLTERGNRTALAGDLGRDALKDFRRQVRIHQDGKLRLAQHVDETGRHHEALGVDDAASLRSGECADLRDAAIDDADIAGIPRRAGAVNDMAIANDDIERLGGGQQRS